MNYWNKDKKTRTIDTGKKRTNWNQSLKSNKIVKSTKKSPLSNSAKRSFINSNTFVLLIMPYKKRGPQSPHLFISK